MLSSYFFVKDDKAVFGPLSDALDINRIEIIGQCPMDKHPRVGIVSPSVLNPNGSFQGTGGYFPTIFRVFAWMFFLDDLPLIGDLIKPYHPMHPWSFFYRNDEYYSRSHEQDWVTGAFLLARKQAINKAGYFDKDYFMYVEEVDLCFRIKKLGYQVWYLPKWKIIHYGQVSAGSEMALINEFKGLTTFYRKHYNSWLLPVLILLLKLGITIRMILYLFTKGVSFAKIYAKAFGSF